MITAENVPQRRPRVGNGSTIRVLVAIESTRDRTLLPALQSAVPVLGGTFMVTRRCMTAEQLEAAIMEGQADAALIGDGLFGLDGATLARCADAGVPTVVLGSAPSGHAPGIIELPSETEPAQICAVLGATVWGSREQLSELLEAVGSVSSDLSTRRAHGGNPDMVQSAPARLGHVVVLVGPPHGNVGTTRASIELAAARERHEPTLLVDAVLDEPSVAAALGLNPARNLTVLAASVAADPSFERWPRLLRDELQPLDPQACPRAGVLAGVPSPALRHRLDPEFLVTLIEHASGSLGFGDVVVDAGAEPPPGTLEGACWRALVDLADRVFVLALPDVVGLRRALGTLERLQARVSGERLGVVLNRYRRGEHDDPADIAAVLRGVPVVAVVPDDLRGCNLALRHQRPLGSVGRSPAARELRRLADRLHEVSTLPRAFDRRPRARWWQRLRRS